MSEQIRACQERAADAKRRAEGIADPALKADFLEMEKCWLTLARSYAFTDSLGDFTAAMSDTLHQLTDPAAIDTLQLQEVSALQLQEVSTLLIQEGNIDALYEPILAAAIRLMSADIGSMQMLYPERNELRLLASKGFHPESAAFWEWVRVDSAATCGRALLSGTRVVVSDIEACDMLAGTPDLDAYRRSGIRAVQSTPLVSRSGQSLGMISTHWREPHQPTERALRLLDVLARQAADLIERSKAEAALHESEERARQLAWIVESTDDAIYSTDLDGIVTSWNRSAAKLYGYTAEEMVGQSIMLVIPPNEQDDEIAILARIKRGERVDHYDTIRRCKAGRLVHISLTVSPLKDSSGRIIGASKIARDITARKQAEEHVRLLSGEVDHRAMNLLSLVQATVHMSDADTTHDLKAAIDGRIQALSKAHRLLAESRWAGADLGVLLREELSPFCSQQVLRANLSGPTVRLKPDEAQSMAMLVHELTTNAVKYGALSVEAGCVRVDWSRGEAGRLLLRWTEVGGPSIEVPRRRGFGTRVIEQLLRQRNGEVRFDWRVQGLACEIALPMPDDSSTSSAGPV